MLSSLAVVGVLAGLSYAYLYPGGTLLLDGSTTTVMSDDTDQSPASFVYAQFFRSVDQDWTRALYGAVYVETGDPTRGAAAWIPVVERVVVLGARPFVPIEQMAVALAFVLIILTGLSFYALGRAWNWSRGVSLALAIAWAFCPFTRARAMVHTAMVGTYHLPLIFLGLTLVATGRTRRSLLGAAMCLLFATTTLHYFVVTAAALTPLFLIYVWITRTHAAATLTIRLALATLPAALWLGWSVTHPVPAELAVEAAFPRTGETAPGQRHPFLWTYAARPLDYLGGDVALAGERRDWLWPRRLVDDQIVSTLGRGNAHERTNGVRWLVLALSLIGVAAARPRRLAWFFFGFAVVSFWLSLDPDWPLPHLGLSGGLQTLVAQVRVPSRAGIGVHFALLVLAGLALKTRAPRWLLLPGLLPALMVLEYPPFLNLEPTAPVRAPYASLPREGCGLGLLFPFVSDQLFEVGYYHFKQRLRDTDCRFVNAINAPDVQAALYAKFPTTPEYVMNLGQNLTVADRLVEFARCASLDWIAFDPAVPTSLAGDVCARLGGALGPDLACVTTSRAPRRTLSSACF